MWANYKMWLLIINIEKKMPFTLKVISFFILSSYQKLFYRLLIKKGGVET
jgi:hypothetical protein